MKRSLLSLALVVVLLPSLVFAQATQQDALDAKNAAFAEAQFANQMKLDSFFAKSNAEAWHQQYQQTNQAHLTPCEIDKVGEFETTYAECITEGTTLDGVAQVLWDAADVEYDKGLEAYYGGGPYMVNGLPVPNYDDAVGFFNTAASMYNAAGGQWGTAACGWYPLAEDAMRDACTYVITAEVNPNCLECGVPDAQCGGPQPNPVPVPGGNPPPPPGG